MSHVLAGVSVETRSKEARPHVSLGAMPDVVARGVRSMLAPYNDRVILRDSHNPSRGSDLLMLDPEALPTRERAAIESTWRISATPLVYYSHKPARSTTRLPLIPSLGTPRGWLCIQRSASQLVIALERIHDGEVVIDGIGVTRFSQLDDSGSLSPREAEVLALIGKGLRNQEIVDHTHLSINSVKSYIRNAYRKIGASSRSEAVLWCVKHRHLITTETLPLREGGRTPLGARSDGRLWPPPQRGMRGQTSTLPSLFDRTGS